MPSAKDASGLPGGYGGKQPPCQAAPRRRRSTWNLAGFAGWHGACSRRGTPQPCGFCGLARGLRPGAPPADRRRHRVGTLFASRRDAPRPTARPRWHGACYGSRRAPTDDATGLARRLLAVAPRRRPRPDAPGFESRVRRNASLSPGRSPRHAACDSPPARRGVTVASARPLKRPGLVRTPPARFRSRGTQKALFLWRFGKYLLWITRAKLCITCSLVWKTPPNLVLWQGVV